MHKQAVLPHALSTWVDESALQTLVQSVLSHALARGATQAELGVGISEGLTVSVRLGAVDNIEFQKEKGLDITVYHGQKRGSASTTDWSPAAIQATIEAATNIAKFTETDPYAGLADPYTMATCPQALDLYHPWALSVEEAVDMARATEAAALEESRIVNSEGASLSSSQSYQIYANTHGFIGAVPKSRHSMSCQVIAGESDLKETDYDYTVHRCATSMQTPRAVGQSAAAHTIAKLGGRRIKTQSAPILFRSDMATGLWGAYFQAISGGALYRQSSFLLNSLGTTVFPDFVQLVQKPFMPRAFGSAWFDAQGVQTVERIFVENGTVCSYLLDAYTARQLKMTNTGNAGGLFNLHVQSHGGDLSALLQQMGTGFFVCSLMGQGVNMVTGDYSRGASGFWVENGQIQYPVEGVTIAGNLKDMFQQIVAIGTDVDTRQSLYTGSLLIEKMIIAGE